MLQAVKLILSIFDLDLRLEGHNHCAKYEHPWSKNRKGFPLQAVLQILSIFDFDLWLQCPIENLKSSLYQQSLY